MRPKTGEVRVYVRADGGLTFSLRMTLADSSRQTFLLGRDTNGWTWEGANTHFAQVLAQLRRGESWPPDPMADEHEQTIGHYARDLLSLHPEANTLDWNWRIDHLAPFAGKRPGQVTSLEVRRFRAALQNGTPAPAVDIADTDRAGSNIRKRPANSSINKFISFLGRVLEHAETAYGFGPGRKAVAGLRLPEPPGKHIWLEADEVRSLLKAAHHLDRWPHWGVFLQATEVAELRDHRGWHWKMIAAHQQQAIATVWRQYQLYHRG